MGNNPQGRDHRLDEMSQIGRKNEMEMKPQLGQGDPRWPRNFKFQARNFVNNPRFGRSVIMNTDK